MADLPSYSEEDRRRVRSAMDGPAPLVEIALVEGPMDGCTHRGRIGPYDHLVHVVVPEHDRITSLDEVDDMGAIGPSLRVATYQRVVVCPATPRVLTFRYQSG